MSQLAITLVAIIIFLIILVPPLLLDYFRARRAKPYRVLRIPFVMYGLLLGYLGFGVIAGMRGWKLLLGLIGILIFVNVAFSIYARFVEQYGPKEMEPRGPEKGPGSNLDLSE